MAETETVQRDILLIITVALVIFFITGIGTVPSAAGPPTVLP